MNENRLMNEENAKLRREIENLSAVKKVYFLNLHRTIMKVDKCRQGRLCVRAFLTLVPHSNENCRVA